MMMSRRATTLCLSSVLLLSLVLAPCYAQNDALRAFAQWLGDHKVQSNVNLGVFEGARFGGVAGKPLAEGDFLVRVPKEVLLTHEVVSANGPFPNNKVWGTLYEPYQAFLLAQKLNPNSQWRPYIDILPTDYSFHPLLWNDAELDQLQASPLRTQIPTLRNQIRLAYDHFVESILPQNPQAFPEGYLTYDRYLWAYLATTTRIWSANNRPVMVPLADMLNHDPLAGGGSLTADGEFFVINTTRTYQKGEQVFDSYGPKSNFDLLRTYGFCLDENPADSMTLHFQLKTTSLVQSIVEPILKKSDPEYASVAIAKNRRPDKLLRAYRLASLEFKEMEYLNDAIEGKPVTLSNELKAYRNVISSLQALLKGYSTTSEQDAELLKNTEIDHKTRNAICLRKSEKDIIKNNILVMGKLWENILLEGSLPLGVPIR